MAKTVHPDSDYIIPLGKARIALEADPECTMNGESVGIVTYGMGVHWSLNAAKDFKGKVEILDLRSLAPYDEEAIESLIKKHGKAIILTEEPIRNSFAESLAGKFSETCFQYLDAPIALIGAENVPAVALNIGLEAQMLPNAERISKKIKQLLSE